MNKFGINETKRTYTCTKCKEFVFRTRQVGDEKIPKSRRIYCNRCGSLTPFALDPLPKKKVE
jgi:DNA-directed RNA polymerase subunit RPC12/RpoP